MTDEELKEALEAIMVSGVKTIVIGDKTISYRDQKELEAQLEKINKRLRTKALYANPYVDRDL